MQTLVTVFSKPQYILLTLVVTLSLITFAAWLPNLHLVAKVMTSSSMSIVQKTNLLASLLGSLQTNFTFLSRTTTFLTAGLAGIQTSLLIFYVRRAVQAKRELGMSALGTAVSLLGIGCASCGSVLLSTFVGLSTSTYLLGYLPYRGQEFSFIGIAVLLTAIWFTLHKINEPDLCLVPKNGK